MKAIQVTHFAEDGNITFSENVPMPQLKRASNDLLVRVLASALNPGDCHMMAGALSLFMVPKSFPYTIGMDVCGIVEDIGDKCTTFAKGDRVVIALEPQVEYGGMAEYLVCDAERACHVPTQLTTIEAASFPIAGTTALKAVKDARIQAGSKVMVIGASGGIGCSVIQLAKAHGASFVAALSTNEKLVKSLGADQAIDYRSAKWWEVLKGKDLDAVIDLYGCDESWANCAHAMARNGRYVAVSVTPEPRVRNVLELAQYAGKVLGRVLNPFSTTYRMVSSFPKGAEVKELLGFVESGLLRPVIDPQSPFEFSLTGAERAIALQKSHHAKGKLVVAIANAQ